MNRQRGDVHHQKAGQIIEIEAQRTPVGFQCFADPVIEIDGQQHEEKAEHTAAVLVGEGEHIGKQPPDLPLQNSGRIKAEPVVHLQAAVVAREEIDDQIANADVKHQVRDALVAVFEHKAVEISAQAHL